MNHLLPVPASYQMCSAVCETAALPCDVQLHVSAFTCHSLFAWWQHMGDPTRSPHTHSAVRKVNLGQPCVSHSCQWVWTAHGHSDEHLHIPQ